MKDAAKADPAANDPLEQFCKEAPVSGHQPSAQPWIIYQWMLVGTHRPIRKWQPATSTKYLVALYTSGSDLALPLAPESCVLQQDADECRVYGECLDGIGTAAQ